jgi:dTDP-4-amino-4,6-dideoxygalactose transaminase
MTEASAAMGLTSLESIDEFIATNRSNYLRYAAELADVPGLRLKRYGERGAQNYQYIVVEVDETVTGLSRDEIVALLHDENVLARRYFYPGCHRMEPYRSTRPDLSAKLPVTCRLAESVLALPTGTAVSEADIRVICSLLRTMVAGAEAIRVCRSAETSRSVTEGS